MLLFVVTVQTIMLFDKVRATYVDHVLSYDLNIPTWPFFAVAWLGDVSRRRADRDPRLSAGVPAGAAARRSRAASAECRIGMSNDFIAVAGFVALFVLMLLRVPVGMAMGLVGVTGYCVIAGAGPALKLVGQTSMRTVTDYTFGVIPMFMLMGAFVSVSGLSRELFRAADAFVGHLRGGLGIATVVACGGFAAICGSSVATAATFSTVAYPEMRRYGYPQTFSTGVIAAGGTLGAMLPPSTVLAVYAILTQQDIGKLFMAGVLPGPARDGDVRADDRAHRRACGPSCLPAGAAKPWRERLVALQARLAAAGAVRVRHRRAVRRRLHADRGRRRRRRRRVPARRAAPQARPRRHRDALLQATRTAAAVFTVLIGALLFGYFLTITQTPQKLTAFLTGLGIGRYGVLALIMVMYLVLGCLMDAMAMIILTVPIIFPVDHALGFDPIWFGVIIVMTVELGLIHPPVGMNVFVIKSVVQEVSFTTIFKGVLPFVATDILRLVILIAFPIIALWLPQRMG